MAWYWAHLVWTFEGLSQYIIIDAMDWLPWEVKLLASAAHITVDMQGCHVWNLAICSCANIGSKAEEHEEEAKSKNKIIVCTKRLFCKHQIGSDNKELASTVPAAAICLRVRLTVIEKKEPINRRFLFHVPCIAWRVCIFKNELKSFPQLNTFYFVVESIGTNHSSHIHTLFELVCWV